MPARTLDECRALGVCGWGWHAPGCPDAPTSPVRCRRCGGSYVESASVLGEPMAPFCRRCGSQDRAADVAAPHRAP